MEHPHLSQTTESQSIDNNPTNTHGTTTTTTQTTTKGQKKPARPPRPPRPPRRRRKKSAKLYAIQKDRSHEFHLQLDIHDLQREIQSLQMLKRVLYTRVLPPFTVDPQDTLQAKVVREFDEVFRNGYRDYDDNYQRSFLASVMHDQVDCGEGVVGVEALCTRFRALDVSLPKIAVEMNVNNSELVRLDQEFMVTTPGYFEAVITRYSLETMFPGVLQSELVAQKIMGKVIICPVKWRFRFNAQGQVTHFGLEIDYIGPLTRLLGDLGHVSLALGENADWRCVPCGSRQ